MSHVTIDGDQFQDVPVMRTSLFLSRGVCSQVAIIVAVGMDCCYRSSPSKGGVQSGKIKLESFKDKLQFVQL